MKYRCDLLPSPKGDGLPVRSPRERPITGDACTFGLKDYIRTMSGTSSRNMCKEASQELEIPSLLRIPRHACRGRKVSFASFDNLTVFCGLRGSALKDCRPCRHGLIGHTPSHLRPFKQTTSLSGELGQLQTLSFQGQLPPVLSLMKYQRNRTYPSSRIYLLSEGTYTRVWKYLMVDGRGG